MKPILPKLRLADLIEIHLQKHRDACRRGDKLPKR